MALGVLLEKVLLEVSKRLRVGATGLDAELVHRALDVGALDVAVDEALKDYIARREREIPAVEALNNSH